MPMDPAFPAGSTTELQYRSSATAFGAVTGSTWDGTTLTLPNLQALDAGAITAYTLTGSSHRWILYDAVGAASIVFTGLDGGVAATSFTASSLTSGRVPYASTGGLLVDSANLTFGETTLTLSQGSADTDAFDLFFRKARGTVASPTVITTGDDLGVINFRGYSGAAGYVTGAQIRAVSEGTIATTRVPAKLVFATGTDAAPTVLTDRMTIDSAGLLSAGMATFTKSQNGSSYVNVINATNGTSALAGIYVNDGTKGFSISYRAAAYTDDATLANFGVLRTDSAVGGLKIRTGGSAAPIYLGVGDVDGVIIGSGGNFGLSQTTWGTSAAKVFAHGSGTAPSTSPADCYQLYSADQAAGNACPHIRTENGATIKLFQASLIADPSGGGTQDAEARTSIVAILDLLIANGLMAAA